MLRTPKFIFLRSDWKCTFPVGRTCFMKNVKLNCTRKCFGFQSNDIFPVFYQYTGTTYFTYYYMISDHIFCSVHRTAETFGWASFFLCFAD